jgi:hypothetical protein
MLFNLYCSITNNVIPALPPKGGLVQRFANMFSAGFSERDPIHRDKTRNGDEMPDAKRTAPLKYICC